MKTNTVLHPAVPSLNVVVIPQPIGDKIVYDVWQGDNIVEGGYSHPTEDAARLWCKEMGYTVYEPLQ